MGEPHSKEAAREDHTTKGPTFSSGIKRSRAGETVSSVSTLAVKKNNQDSVPVVTSTLPSPSTVRKKHRIEGEKVCKVCGDKAATHHFDVMTCESCKTFFRRNANKPQKVCLFEDKCQITVNTRRFCPACRLQKCFDLGMRADFILDEEEKKVRMEKIRMNRLAKEAAQKEEQAQNNSRPPCFICSPDSDGIDLLLQEPDTAQAVEALLSDLSRAEPSRDAPRPAQNHATSSKQQSEHVPSSSTQHSDSPNNNGVQTATTSQLESAAVNCDSAGSSHLDDPQADSPSSTEGHHTSKAQCCSSKEGKTPEKSRAFISVPVTLLPSDPKMFWMLTPEETKLIKLLSTAFENELVRLHLTVPESLITQMAQLSFDKGAEHMNQSLCEIINFLKQIPDFRSLHVNDQGALLKANGKHLMNIFHCVFYSEERGAWIKDKGIVTVEQYFSLCQDKELALEVRDLSLSLQRILNKDYASYGILLCATFFDPLAPGLSDRQKVNYLYDKYTLLQKHHLESKHSYVFAPQYRDAIQETVLQVKSASMKWAAIISKWKDAFNPLILELMNLQ